MHVANQGLEFSQAIWFMLERNAVECHVVLIAGWSSYGVTLESFNHSFRGG